MDNKVITQVQTFIKKHNLLPSGSTVILGLSGGPDSVFLLHFLADMHKKGEIKLIAVHLDHEWRPESARDVAFCQEITEKLGISFITSKASELDIGYELKGSQEELGRRLRRFFLEKVCVEQNADCIALAHHLQDQQETFFIRLLRGATLTGLAAMRPKHGSYIHPLLEVDKVDILRYLEEHKISYLTDPTNILDIHLRNRIRNNVIPELRKADPRFDLNFFKTIKHLQKAEIFLEYLTEKNLEEISEYKDEKYHLDVTKFLALDPVLQKRILILWMCKEKVPFYPSESFLDEIIRFLKQPGSKEHQIHELWRLTKKKKQVSIQQLQK